MQILSAIREEAIDWCKGKNGWIRVPFLLFFFYLMIGHLWDPRFSSIISPLNLGIHELGHIIFGIFGDFIGVLGGSLLQCLAPLLAMINFYKQRDYFALSLCPAWLSLNLFEVATYMGDAKEQSLPLVGFVDNPIHDWHYILGKLHLINQCGFLANLTRLMAVTSMMVSLVIAGGLIWNMITNPSKEN